MKQILSCLILLSCLNCHVFAQGGNEYVPLLEEVIVVEKQQQELGESLIGGSQLEMLPSRSGSITEALKVMSNIQYDYATDSSMTLGEITPPRISIAGAKPYENNYLIDGMSITNTLNPSGFDDSATQSNLAVGGGDQAIFYDTHLLDSITVYDSNVPAEYGGFVGGVVDAELKKPRNDHWHFMLSEKYTRDAWFSMNNDININSETPNEQSKFSNYNVNLFMDGPISNDLSALVFFSRRHSIIPLKRELPDETLIDDDQTRTNENYFVRLVYKPKSKLTLKFDATYAPYTSHLWREAWPDSDWRTENQSWRFATHADYQLNVGMFSAKLVYALNGFSRKNNNAYRHIFMDFSDTTLDDNYGGVGDAEVENVDVSAEIAFHSKQFDIDDLFLTFATGVEVGSTKTNTWNESAVNDVMLVFSSGSSMHTRSEFYEVSQSDDLLSIGGYSQIELILKRLRLIPGLRLDYDDFARNVDIAPRIKAEYDTFGNGTIRLIAGINRYYSSSLRGYAFDRHRPSYSIQIRRNGAGIVTRERQYETGDNNFSSDNLDTPYSDEMAGGIVGTVLGVDYGINLIFREHKKQLISETEDEENYYMTNNGSSEYKGVTVTLSKKVQTDFFGHHGFSISASQSKTKSFNGDYDTQIFTEEIEDGFEYNYNNVFYNGNFISRSDLPAQNYNAPLVCVLSVNNNFFSDRLRFNTVARWRDSAEGMVKDKKFANDTPFGTTDGGESSLWVNDDMVHYSDAYIEGSIKGGWRADMSIEYDVLKSKMYELTVEIDIVNLFNDELESSVVVDDTTDTSKNNGRGVYLGLRATF